MPLGGAAKCPKCLKAVYYADETTVKGKKWHKSCLTCGLCSKALDSFSMNELEGTLYCKTCFVKVGGSAAGSAPADRRSSSASAFGLGEDGDGARAGCPRCGRAVFFAEEKLAFGNRWHKMCFKCAECSKLLDSSSAAERDGEAFCKACYGKLYGPKGYGFAGGSAGLSANQDTRYADDASLSNSFAEAQAAPLLRRQSTVSSGPVCPCCGTTVYFAEEVIAIGSKWHKLCLKCVVCSKLLTGGSVQEHAGAPHCKACYGKVHGPKGYGFGGVGAGLSANQGDETGSKPSTYAEAQAAPLLRRQSTVGNGPQCPSCGTTVYYAEEVIAVGKKWHKLCLKCVVCSKLLDGGSVQEHAGAPHCKTCYGKRHGPRGYGFGGVGAGLAANREDDDGGVTVGKPSSYAEAQAAPLLRRQSTIGSGPLCRGCGTTVFFAEEVSAVGGKWHKLCLKCDACGKLLDGGSVQERAGVPHCKACYGKRHGPRGYGFGGVGAGLAANREDEAAEANGAPQSSYAEAQVAPLQRKQSSVGSSNGGGSSSSSGASLCPRCRTAVYFAEEVVAAGNKWHRMCLKCGSCGKPLDSGSVQEHDGMPYCRTCYGRSFGPRGYGFAGGAAGLSANREDGPSTTPDPSSRQLPGEEIWSPLNGTTEVNPATDVDPAADVHRSYAYSTDELSESVGRIGWAGEAGTYEESAAADDAYSCRH